jgi:hypothetical protein
MRMSINKASRGVAIVFALVLVACFGNKPAPKSTTTTRTQTVTERNTGQSTTSDVVETRTEQADGTQDVVRSETIKQSKPPANP